MRQLTRPVCPNPGALRTNYKHPENKKALQDASHGKCMYCESKVSHVYFGDVEHIRPKAEGKYPHLQFEWSNLGYCCAQCNNAKKDEFDEACPLIDPYSEDPADHLFAFGPMVKYRKGSERGALTITTIDLNRVELVEKRGVRISEMQNAIDACFRTRSDTVRKTLLEALQQENAAEREFSMFAAALMAANDI
jgi:uncharacterized protein (TIGR02646 family)